MAHFAEIDKNNKVLRVVVGDNQDILDNGGEQSEQAAKHFETVLPLSPDGVKWVQTSYNHNFRKQYATIGGTYDSTKDKFIAIQNYPSWTLNDNDDWEAPVPFPIENLHIDGNYSIYVEWDEENLRWTARDLSDNNFRWEPSSSSWVLIT